MEMITAKIGVISGGGASGINFWGRAKLQSASVADNAR